MAHADDKQQQQRDHEALEERGGDVGEDDGAGERSGEQERQHAGLQVELALPRETHRN